MSTKTTCLYPLKTTKSSTRSATRLKTTLSQGSSMYNPDVMLYLKRMSSTKLRVELRRAWGARCQQTVCGACVCLDRIDSTERREPRVDSLPHPGENAPIPLTLPGFLHPLLQHLEVLVLSPGLLLAARCPRARPRLHLVLAQATAEFPPFGFRASPSPPRPIRRVTPPHLSTSLGFCPPSPLALVTAALALPPGPPGLLITPPNASSKKPENLQEKFRVAKKQNSEEARCSGSDRTGV